MSETPRAPRQPRPARAFTLVERKAAKARAKATSSPRTVQFVVAGAQYKIPEETMFNDPLTAYSVSLRDDPYRSYIHSIDLGGDRELSFDGFGRPDADGAIIIRAGDRRLAVLIDAATGEITIEEATTTLQSELLVKGVMVAVD